VNYLGLAGVMTDKVIAFAMNLGNST
jgi:hypothetical protein